MITVSLFAGIDLGHQGGSRLTFIYRSMNRYKQSRPDYGPHDIVPIKNTLPKREEGNEFITD